MEFSSSAAPCLLRAERSRGSTRACCGARPSSRAQPSAASLLLPAAFCSHPEGSRCLPPRCGIHQLPIRLKRGRDSFPNGSSALPWCPAQLGQGCLQWAPRVTPSLFLLCQHNKRVCLARFPPSA